MRKSIAVILITVTLGVPASAVADHVPDNFAQELDPNYVACLMAVDDAAPDFRDVLQYTCLEHMGNICSGRDGVAPPSQVIGCIYFETLRGIAFLEAGVADLPVVFEQEGFFGRGYKRRRDRILRDIDTLKNSPKPQSIEIAIEQVVSMASAVQMLFWIARKTETPLEAHALATVGDH